MQHRHFNQQGNAHLRRWFSLVRIPCTTPADTLFLQGKVCENLEDGVQVSG